MFVEGDVGVVAEALRAGATTSLLTEVEAHSAVHRRIRSGDLPERVARTVLSHLRDILDQTARLDFTQVTRESALKLLADHPLRALDAIQLATAVVEDRAARRHGMRVMFCTADRRQAEAARNILGERRTLLLDPL